MQEVKLSVNLINGILGYLGTRPYSEVYQFIQAIHEAAKPQEAPQTAEEVIVVED